jgi:citrate lyase subunit beta/citryl-CoA lyase
MANQRRSLLFIPGNNPGMIQNAQVFGADSVIFDLEDAVSVDEKDAARILVCQALETFDFKPSERIVRVNPMDTVWGREDVKAVGEKGPDTILVPKANESAIKICHEILDDLEEKNHMPKGSLRILALIESAYGVERASEIIKMSDRVDGILLGGEDYTADLEVNRTKKGREIFYARTRLANLCKAHGIVLIDTPFADVDDMLGLKEDAKEAASLGATGKAAINPRQIDSIHEVFSPSEEEVSWAIEVVEAFEEAKKEGLGVFSLRGKMVDAPVVLRAKNILSRSQIDVEKLLEGGQDYA